MGKKWGWLVCCSVTKNKSNRNSLLKFIERQEKKIHFVDRECDKEKRIKTQDICERNVIITNEIIRKTQNYQLRHCQIF